MVGSGDPAASTFYESLADADAAALMRLRFAHIYISLTSSKVEYSYYLSSSKWDDYSNVNSVKLNDCITAGKSIWVSYSVRTSLLKMPFLQA